MTSQHVHLHDQQHVVDHLPAYVNGTLDSLATRRVRDHLLVCEACRGELATWEVLRDAARADASAAPLPSVNVLSRAMEAIDREASTAQRAWSPVVFFVHLWLLCKNQARIIHKSIWIVTPLVMLFATALSLAAIEGNGARLPFAESVLSLITALSAASGAAFLFGEENDPGLEITLSTPTSMRLVMLCRLGLAIGYNVALAAIASLIIAVAHGGSVWEIMQTWLGPLLLLSSITLILSVVIGSWFAMLAGILLESLRALPGFLNQHAPLLQTINPASWPTNPAIVFLAVLLIVFAVFYAPRQPRLLR